ncbi:GIN domain-containing protein [Alistipes sp. CHKCI003]|uniref:GIN domain-containing protein n=1 Tax=Alistipes sp. CHKCI003 TaxID=1780376 RepID=UPI0007A911FA|nr:DUF2807 domain-containing protein [Alistipes sp. CHKCI003]CVI72477.1 hypothetical protein BN3659_02529 [Alistipes sp. CHKCI003]
MKHLLQISICLLLLSGGTESVARTASGETFRTEESAGAERTAPKKRRAKKGPKRLKGSGRFVTRAVPCTGDYAALCVRSGVRVTVDPSATEILLTADDNAIDYVTAAAADGCLVLGFEARGVHEVSGLTLEAVVPASADLARIEVSSYGSVKFLAPVENVASLTLMGGGQAEGAFSGERMTVFVSGYGRFMGRVGVSGECEVGLSGGSRFDGDIEADELSLMLSGYAEYAGDARARSSRIMLTGGSRFDGEAALENYELQLSGYAEMQCDLTGGTKGRISVGGGSRIGGAVETAELEVIAGGYAKFDGGIRARMLRMECASGSTMTATCDLDRFEAAASGYAKIYLRGGGPVAEGSVSVCGGASFRAPELDVADYRIEARSYGKASVRCSHSLSTRTDSGGQIDFAGECEVRSYDPNVRRR